MGEPSVYIAGLEGIVTAHTDDTVTIGGFTLPTRLNAEGGVKYLSCEWPRDSFGLERADPHEDCIDAEDLAAIEHQMVQLARGIEKLHDEHHVGAFRTCLHEVCREADS